MEAALWIFGFLVFVAIAKSSAEKTERMTWSNEKLEARKNYLLHHDLNPSERDKLYEEEDRRVSERLKASSKAEWEKYK